jgi:hypothetical protein
MLPQRTRFERVLCAVVALLVTAHTTSAVSTDAGARHLPRRLLTTDDYYEGAPKPHLQDNPPTTPCPTLLCPTLH